MPTLLVVALARLFRKLSRSSNARSFSCAQDIFPASSAYLTTWVSSAEAIPR
jgi:hypothetical protein